VNDSSSQNVYVCCDSEQTGVHKEILQTSRELIYSAIFCRAVYQQGHIYLRPEKKSPVVSMESNVNIQFRVLAKCIDHRFTEY